MNKIVRHHYPADLLPEDLRAGLSNGALVRIEVEEEKPLSRQELLELFEAAAKLPPATDDPVARIRALRDEWDD